jgi:hypothetical protein
MAKGLKVGYTEVTEIERGLPRPKFAEPQRMGTGERHAFLDGQAVSLCGQPILDATDIDWPGPDLGTPWCEVCLSGATAAPTPL